MLKILKNFDSLKKAKLSLLIEDKKDLSLLNNFSVNKSIIENSNTILDKKENTFKSFFIWSDKLEIINLIFFLDDSKKSKIEFIGENLSKITWDIYLYLKEDLDTDLLDTFVLWKYSFDRYKSDAKEEKIVLITDKNIEKINTRLKTLENIISARDLVNEPSSFKTPKKIVEIVKAIDWKKTKISILNHSEIKEKWLNLIDAVWRASSNKPYLLILERIVDSSKIVYGLVWKWITFDTGWLNIKSDKGMTNMKDDMWWAASVIYTMKELDENNTDVNIVAAISLAENSISWDAYRPSDIIKSYSGKTVEVLNTDAEWRLVMADAISYISRNYELSSITSIATLTWSCMLALGYNYAAIMWTNRSIIDKLLSDSKESFEKYWELPFSPYYIEKTKWEISDLKNLSEWVYSWSTMWWSFLYNFLEKSEKFSHIDITWTAFRPDNYWLFTK